MSNGGRSFLIGFAIGGLIGFIKGLLIAPSSGKETREKISWKSQEAAEQFQDSVNEARNKVEDAAEIIKEKIDTLKKEQQEKNNEDEITYG